jgi:PEP-CTERM motif
LRDGSLANHHDQKGALMKSFQTVGLLAVAAALICLSVGAIPAHANGVFSSVYVSGIDGTNPGYDWTSDDPGTLNVDEVWDSSVGSDYGLSVWGETTGDPILTITKDILNGTSTAWVGYNITLDPFDTDTFTGVPTSGGTSGGMTLGFMDGYNLNWTTPNVVLPGQNVTFTFNINVPDTGAFNFTLSQSPVLIPEPATITLFGLAMVAFAVCRKRLSR